MDCSLYYRYHIPIIHFGFPSFLLECLCTRRRTWVYYYALSYHIILTLDILSTHLVLLAGRVEVDEVGYDNKKCACIFFTVSHQLNPKLYCFINPWHPLIWRVSHLFLRTHATANNKVIISLTLPSSSTTSSDVVRISEIDW